MAKKKLIAIIFACAAVLLVVTAPCLFQTADLSVKPETSTNQTTTDDDLPVIKIGIDIKTPFVYVGTDGDYTGIDADIAREACKRAGLRPEFVRIDWNERDDLLAKGEIDCIWCGYSWNSRADRYRWTHTYLTTDISVLIKKDAPAKSLTDLTTETVAVRAGSVSERKLLTGALGTSDSLTVRAYGSVDLSIAAFVKGYTDCWMGYDYLAQRILAQSPDKYRYLSQGALTIDLGVAFDTDYQGDYLDKLNVAIDAMKDEGVTKKIEKQYVEQLVDAQRDEVSDED